MKCECLDEDGLKIRDEAGHWLGKIGKPPGIVSPIAERTYRGIEQWLPDEPPVVEGRVFSVMLTERTDSQTVIAQVYSATERGQIYKLFEIPLKNFAWNGYADICRDNGGARVWFAERIGTGIYASRARPYKALERFSGPGVVDQLLDIQESAKRIKRSVARFDLRQLGSGISAAAKVATFCQARLNEQLQAGGVDSEFDREAIRRRVGAELFMADRVFRDLEDLNTLGSEFRMTDRDVQKFHSEWNGRGRLGIIKRLPAAVATGTPG